MLLARSKSLALALALVAAGAACGKSRRNHEVASAGGDAGEATSGAAGSGGAAAGGGSSGTDAPGGSASSGAAGATGSGGGAGASCQYEYPLEEYCEGLLGCPWTEEEALDRYANACPLTPTTIIFVRKGCGMVVVGLAAGEAGSGFVFDEASGALIGVYNVSRGSAASCNFREHAGVWPGDCTEMTQCDLCAPVQNLDCRFDCDCNEPPGIDPCHDPSSCGCYCRSLASTKPIPEW